MADLFMKQAEDYAESRPAYPLELFQFIASKTPHHHLAWDVGTGTGLAAATVDLSISAPKTRVISLAKMYKNVIATDTSPGQLQLAPRLPNVRYKHTHPAMSTAELEHVVAPGKTVDLVIVAQALHWFDLPTFYKQVKHVLKEPHGVMAAWCYTIPQINEQIDSIFKRIYYVDSRIYWHPGRNLLVDKYRGIEFPFEPLDGLDNTGPFEFETVASMDLESYIKYIKSSSAYQTAKDRGVELLTEDVIEEFELAWNRDGDVQKMVKFPTYLRIGKLGYVNK